VLIVLISIDLKGSLLVALASAFNAISRSLLYCCTCFIYMLLFICKLKFSGSGRRCCDN
jgi:hypothetical protein